MVGTVACGQVGDEGAKAPTVDINAVADRVLDRIESQLPQPDPPAQEVDVESIVDQVVEQVEGRLEAQPTPMPVVNNEAMAAAAIDLQETLIELYQRANPSTVFVLVPPLGSGSGFVYDQQGHIVTNNHVVDGGEEYEVVFADGQRSRAELVGTDVDSDLAVLKVDQLPPDASPLPLANPGSIEVGQFVVAIGNPFGEQGSMSLGIVSGLGRSLESQRRVGFGSSYSLPQVIQTDAPINPGNSGGPLLNLDGQVVGVNAAIATTTGTNSGVGFSIPVAAVSRVVPVLIADGEYIYPFMGVSFDGEISLEDLETYEISQSEGAYVISIQEGGPADLAGLIPADNNTGAGGDLIVQLDAQKVRDFDDLNSYLSFNTSVGQTIDVTVLRGDETVVLSLTLGARP
jgi:2-alkenal reductase